LMDYLLPTSMEVPDFEIAILDLVLYLQIAANSHRLKTG